MDRLKRPIILSTAALCLVVVAILSILDSNRGSAPINLNERDDVDYLNSTDQYPVGEFVPPAHIRPIAFNFDPPPLPSMPPREVEQEAPADPRHDFGESPHSSLRLLPPTESDSTDTSSNRASILEEHRLKRLPPLNDADEIPSAAPSRSTLINETNDLPSDEYDLNRIDSATNESTELQMPTLSDTKSPVEEDDAWNDTQSRSSVENASSANDFVPHTELTVPDFAEPWSDSNEPEPGLDVESSRDPPSPVEQPHQTESTPFEAPLPDKSIIRPPPQFDSIHADTNQGNPDLHQQNSGRAMAVVSQRADEIVAHAQSLATRNAPYSARAEFLIALRMLAEALDALDGTADHVRSLDAGLRALKEAEDFVVKSPEASIVVHQVARTHKTPVIKNGMESNTSPVIARQRYYTYAQNKLAECCQSDSAGSRALYGLGKLYSTQALQGNDALLMNGPKAIVFHRAAMMVDSNNYRAANELGVMLGRYGELETAREILLHCLAIERLPEAWYNLSVIHTKLGETDLARRAHYEWNLTSKQREQLANRTGTDAMDLIRWVDTQTFARSPMPAINQKTPPQKSVNLDRAKHEPERRVGGRRTRMPR